jgi:hypothetical protein
MSQQRSFYGFCHPANISDHPSSSHHFHPIPPSHWWNFAGPARRPLPPPHWWNSAGLARLPAASPPGCGEWERRTGSLPPRALLSSVPPAQLCSKLVMTAGCRPPTPPPFLYARGRQVEIIVHEKITPLPPPHWDWRAIQPKPYQI